VISTAVAITTRFGARVMTPSSRPEGTYDRQH